MAKKQPHLDIDQRLLKYGAWEITIKLDLRDAFPIFTD